MGDWRTATLVLSGGDLIDGRSDVQALTVNLRAVARSMQVQCATGDVEMAYSTLEAAADRLAVAKDLVPAEDGRLPRPALGPRPQWPRRLDHLGWWTTALVLRELADLDALRKIIVDLGRGRAELILACIEYFTWVAFDPWTVSADPRDKALLGLDAAALARFGTANRLDMCARATKLRQFGTARGGTVTTKAWKVMGGYPPLRAAALRALAEEPMTRGLAGVPARLGRVRAWEHARRWLDDISA
jgi:hypothetical protein